MSYSRTLQWNKSLFKVKETYSFLLYHTITSEHKPCKNISFQKQPPVRRPSPILTHTRQRYSFVYSSKHNGIFNATLWLRCNSNSKQSHSLGSMDNEGSPLTKSQADDLILRLTEDERKALLSALQEFNSNQIKSEYEAEKVPLPTSQQLIKVGIFNAVPFIGFGFLDNFIMICAGDYIDETLGSLVTISTMAAAALGNTISDVMGIGSAWYVELAAMKIGFKAPNLSPIQLDMKPSRRAANLGRAVGIIVGCLLGMIPLLFIKSDDVKKKKTKVEDRAG